MNTATATTTATAPIVTGISALLRRHRHTLLKTLSYYCLHITVAIAVAYVVTGNWWVAMTLSLLEPTVQMLFFFLHEKLWDRKNKEHLAQATPLN